ncbi:MAG TPA: hypothetical protein VMD29_13500 [Terracidiphilus sp.]|nr:hypothetical protein [Terracidiphilus sp.]
MNELPEKQTKLEEILDKRGEVFRSLHAELPPHPLEKEWAIPGDDVLTSIYRASDLSRRGVRGLIAEYIFDRDVLPSAKKVGWQVIAIPKGDWPYDCAIERGNNRATIQIKLQRLEKGKPKRFWANKYDEIFYDVEVQKTRGGKKRLRKAITDTVEANAVQIEKSTRPYAFGEFDILAVNMQAATGKWTEFRFTVANWLLKRLDAPELIEIHQPVALKTDEAWTDDLNTCLNWLLSGKPNTVLREIKHPILRRSRVTNAKSTGQTST